MQKIILALSEIDTSIFIPLFYIPIPPHLFVNLGWGILPSCYIFFFLLWVHVCFSLFLFAYRDVWVIAGPPINHMADNYLFGFTSYCCKWRVTEATLIIKNSYTLEWVFLALGSIVSYKCRTKRDSLVDSSHFNSYFYFTHIFNFCGLRIVLKWMSDSVLKFFSCLNVSSF